MVGIMVEKLDLEIGNIVLEIGTGSGYHAAIVAEIVGSSGHVYTVERIKSLAERAKENIARCGLSDRITIVVSDGSKGLERYAPYDRIFVTCASPKIPQPLIEQLKNGGKLLIPLGGRYFQDLVGVRKQNNKISRENYGGCVFVPLIGEYGFK
jgi:protein-L-isoaspartate(D-aspartate) O-methyltransferase